MRLNQRNSIMARPFDEAILAEIQAMEQEREQEHKSPVFVLRIDFIRRVNDALNRLYKEGKIRVGETLNDKYISTRPKESDNGKETERKR